MSGVEPSAAPPSRSVVCPSCGSTYPILLKLESCPYCNTELVVPDIVIDNADFLVPWAGLTAFHEGKYLKAISLYQEALQSSQDQFSHAQLHTMIGNAYLKLGWHNNAIKAHQKAIDLEPDSYQAWTNLGVTYRQMGDYPQAAHCFECALELQPNNAETLTNYGVLHLLENKPRKAIRKMREAIKQDPSYADTYANMALALAILKRFGEAEAALKAAIIRGYKNHQVIAERIKALKRL